MADYSIAIAAISNTNKKYPENSWLSVYDEIDNQEIANIIFENTLKHGSQISTIIVQRLCNTRITGVFNETTLKSVNSQNPKLFIFKLKKEKDKYFKEIEQKKNEYNKKIRDIYASLMKPLTKEI